MHHILSFLEACLPRISITFGIQSRLLIMAKVSGILTISPPNFPALSLITYAVVAKALSASEPASVCSGCHNKWQIPQTGALNNRILFPHSFSGWKSKIKCHQGWFLVTPLFLACRRPHSHWIFTWPFLCECAEKETEISDISFSYKNIRSSD